MKRRGYSQQVSDFLKSIYVTLLCHAKCTADFSEYYQPCHVKLTITHVAHFSAGQVYNPFNSSLFIKANGYNKSLQVCSLQVSHIDWTLLVLTWPAGLPDAHSLDIAGLNLTRGITRCPFTGRCWSQHESNSAQRKLLFASVSKRLLARNKSYETVFRPLVFHFHENQIYFHKKGFAWRQRHNVWRKWPIIF